MSRLPARVPVVDADGRMTAEFARAFNARQDAWPVGAIFTSADNVSPAVGYGTWAAFGTGSVTVGGTPTTVYYWRRTA